MSQKLNITSIRFKNFKAFKSYSIYLNEFNILVGPNNAGKSTIISSLRILAEGIRKARSRKPELIKGLVGDSTLGYIIDLGNLPLATENVFHNYDESEPAKVTYQLNNKGEFVIYFLSQGRCYMIYSPPKGRIKTPSEFRNKVNLNIGFVPVLGPVDHSEKLYQKKAARLALLSRTASRNFRNIWFHFDSDFDDFREIVKATWPGMDIEKPEMRNTEKGPELYMLCPEERIPREIYWAGFGFQVWCQMLTYMVKNKDSSLFIIDEPDIYLHSDLQRQLMGILKELGPDIIIATHSTELLSEADINNVLLINKKNSSAKRIKNLSQLNEVFELLGSNLNPVLTQIAKTRKVLFVEGDDFTVLSRFARSLGKNRIANRSDFAVIPMKGFDPIKLQNIKEGIEKTIGSSIKNAAIFDKDYRSIDEVTYIKSKLVEKNEFVHIFEKKEIENYLFVDIALEKAIKERLKNRANRTGSNIKFDHKISSILEELTNSKKIETQSLLQSYFLNFKKTTNPSLDDSTIMKNFLEDFDVKWNNLENRLDLISGKELLSTLNEFLQDNYKISITNAQIIKSMGAKEIPKEMHDLIKKIEDFSKS